MIYINPRCEEKTKIDTAIQFSALALFGTSKFFHPTYYRSDSYCDDVPLEIFDETTRAQWTGFKFTSNEAEYSADLHDRHHLFRSTSAMISRAGSFTVWWTFRLRWHQSSAAYSRNYIISVLIRAFFRWISVDCCSKTITRPKIFLLKFSLSSSYS